MPDDVSPELIQRYLDNQCSRNEAEQVEAWYRSFETNPDHISGLEPGQKEELRLRLLAQVESTIRQKETGRGFTLPAWLKVAAVFILAATGGYLAWDYLAGRQPTRQEEGGLRQIANTKEQLEKHLLPDGSTVWIYPGTRIELPEDFESEKREIRLSGEAFFEVVRDEQRPFLIYSGALITRVLGTSFDIKARPDDATVQVSVLEGSVALTLERQQEDSTALVLTSNQRAVFSKAEHTLVMELPEEPSRQPIWAETSLEFRDTPVREVFAQLSSKFDVEIEPANERLEACTFTAAFSDQNLPVIIDVICKSLQAEYEINSRHILIKGAGCE